MKNLNKLDYQFNFSFFIEKIYFYDIIVNILRGDYYERKRKD